MSFRKHESGAQKRKNRDKLAYESKRMDGAMDRFMLPSTSLPSESDSIAPPATDNTQGDHDADGSNTPQEVSGCKENPQQVVEVTTFSTTERNAQGSDGVGDCCQQAIPTAENMPQGAQAVPLEVTTPGY